MAHWTKTKGIEGLYRYSNGIYYARITKPKRTFVSLRTDKFREARKAIRNLRAEAERRIRPRILPEEIRQFPTFGETTKAFLEKKPEADLPFDKQRVRQSLETMRRHTDVWNKPLDELSAKKLHKAVEAIPHLTNSTKNRLQCSIRKIFLYAEDEEIISEQLVPRMKGFPVRPRKVDLPTSRQFAQILHHLKFPDDRPCKHPPLPSDWENTPRRKLAKKMGVTRSTLIRIIATERGNPPKRRGRPENTFTFRFLCYTGLRLGEAHAARWKDVAEGRLVVRGTKSDSAHRHLPLSPALEELLDEIREYRDTAKPTEPILRKKHIDKPLNDACDRLGIPRLRHHDLRHYFATKAIQSGVDIPTVAKWLGHSDGGVLAMKTYSHVTDEHGMDQARKLRFSSLPRALN